MEHRDRLTRYGFEHVAASMCAGGRRIVVLDDAETSDDLVRDVTEDVTEVLTFMCARRYGRRSASRRAAKAYAVTVVTGGEPG